MRGFRSVYKRQLPAVVDTAGKVTRPMLHSSLAVPSMVANAGAPGIATLCRFLRRIASQAKNEHTAR
jgi:hypothetical protein